MVLKKAAFRVLDLFIISNNLTLSLHDLSKQICARSEMQVFSFSILWSCIVGLFWNVHCIGKVVLKNKFNFTSAVIRSIDLLVSASRARVLIYPRPNRVRDFESRNLWCLFAKSCWNINTGKMLRILVPLMCVKYTFFRFYRSVRFEREF